LGPHDQAISADEKTSIQARRHLVVTPKPGRPDGWKATMSERAPSST
jgi:hypothetical protein